MRNKVLSDIKKTKGIILLSGGLDSLVSLDIALGGGIKNNLQNEQKVFEKIDALLFNYGQKAFKDEKKAVEEICSYYKIDYKIIELPTLAQVSQNALTSSSNNNFNSLEDVWIPNRNGLFLNIAGMFCDKYNYQYIIFGANKQEARDFPDNTQEFINSANEFFKYSTINKIKVFAPCVGFDKIEIVNYAIDNNVPLNLLKSCYQDSKATNKKHCNQCMSCKLLYEAIKKSKKPELIKELF